MYFAYEKGIKKGQGKKTINPFINTKTIQKQLNEKKAQFSIYTIVICSSNTVLL